MRKVVLNMDEHFKYQIIKNLVDNNGNKHNAALKLDCSIRTINRLIINYNSYGKAAFVHGNKSRQPASAFSSNFKSNILWLYNEKYSGSNFAHFKELLILNEDISISYSALYNIFKDNDILSPKCERVTRKNLSKRLKNKSLLSSKPLIDLSVQIPLEDSHPRQERSKYFGEKILMDASVHLWFGDKKAFLHLAIDDSSSTIVGAFFDAQETINGYYNVLNQVLNNYGIPYSIQTDNRTIFNFTKENLSSLERDTYTQFSYACKRLGIELNTTSIAQKQGRVERSFQTHQSRLITELRLAGINTIEDANLFLNDYVIKHNQQFALPTYNIKSVFEVQPIQSDINCILAIIDQRIINSGHAIKFHNKYYLPYQNDKLVILRIKTKCLIIKAFDKQLYLSAADEIFNLVEVEKHQKISQNIDINKVGKPNTKKYIPASNHPWRNSTFLRHAKSQPHRIEKEIDEYYSQAISY